MVTPSTVNRELAILRHLLRLAEEWGYIAKVPAKVDKFRFHDLRHTCASWLLMKGRSLKEVQEILGHREFTMTLRYAHLSPDRLRDAVASLEGFSTRSAQGVKIDPDRRVNPDAPVAQVDRAAVS